MNKIEYINKFTGKAFIIEVPCDKAFQKLNQLRKAWNVASARIIVG